MSRYGELALEEVIYLADKPGLRLNSDPLVVKVLL
jgi:hypothetical protein